jgi:hypothetical protein
MPIGSSRRRRGCAIWKAWAKAGVRSSSVVQPGYETPIKLAFAKCSTAGTHGMDSVYSFEAMRNAVAVGCCAACRTM